MVRDLTSWEAHLMPFEHDALFRFCTAQIEAFAKNHPDETFYRFAIDADLLCLNTEESFAATLKKYQDKWDRDHQALRQISDLDQRELKLVASLLDLHEKYRGLDRSNEAACVDVINSFRAQMRAKGNRYRSAEGIIALRNGTGDWEYQGFARMTEKDGFDHAAYLDHYHSPDNTSLLRIFGFGKSAYAKAMDKLVASLRSSMAFNGLRRTSDFWVVRVEHVY
jgi:hypothetical protein